MNKKIICFIILITVGIISTLWLLKQDTVNQTEKTLEEEKLIGVWKQVKTYSKNTTTQQWQEYPLVPALILYYEFSPDGTSCHETLGIRSTCPATLLVNYTVENNKIKTSGFNYAFTFTGEQLEITYHDPQFGETKLIFERTVRPTTNPSPNNITPDETLYGIFGLNATGGITSDANVTAFEELRNATANRYAIIDFPFLFDAMNIVNAKDNSRDYILLSTVQANGIALQTVTVTSATITLTGSTGICSVDPTTLPSEWKAGQKKQFIFVCGNGNAFTNGEIQGNIEIDYKIIYGANASPGKATGMFKGKAE